MSRTLKSWRPCSVDGCPERYDANGYCGKHERRFRRHGDPLGGTTDRGACIKFINDTAMPFASDDCLLWPFGDNGRGYGVFHVKRRAVSAHVYICERAHGPKPTPKHEVAHGCGNGHLGCVNPRHLRWATRAENHADKRIHGTARLGTKNPSNKLSEADVREIRKQFGTAPQHVISKRFGVTQMTVSHIVTRKQWGWLS